MFLEAWRTVLRAFGKRLYRGDEAHARLRTERQILAYICVIAFMDLPLAGHLGSAWRQE